MASSLRVPGWPRSPGGRSWRRGSVPGCSLSLPPFPSWLSISLPRALPPCSPVITGWGGFSWAEQLSRFPFSLLPTSPNLPRDRSWPDSLLHSSCDRGHHSAHLGGLPPPHVPPNILKPCGNCSWWLPRSTTALDQSPSPWGSPFCPAQAPGVSLGLLLLAPSCLKASQSAAASHYFNPGCPRHLSTSALSHVSAAVCFLTHPSPPLSPLDPVNPPLWVLSPLKPLFLHPLSSLQPAFPLRNSTRVTFSTVGFPFSHFWILSLFSSLTYGGFPAHSVKAEVLTVSLCDLPPLYCSDNKPYHCLLFPLSSPLS